MISMTFPGDERRYFAFVLAVALTLPRTKESRPRLVRRALERLVEVTCAAEVRKSLPGGPVLSDWQ